MRNKKIIIKVIPIIIGALSGYAYYYFIGCYSGSCPISSNPYISTFYGALIGLIWTIPNKRKNDEQSKNN